MGSTPISTKLVHSMGSKSQRSTIKVTNPWMHLHDVVSNPDEISKKVLVVVTCVVVTQQLVGKLHKTILVHQVEQLPVTK